MAVIEKDEDNCEGSEEVEHGFGKELWALRWVYRYDCDNFTPLTAFKYMSGKCRRTQNPPSTVTRQRSIDLVQEVSSTTPQQFSVLLDTMC